MNIEKRISIKATPEKIYNYLLDIPRHSEWASQSIQITPDSNSPIAVGSKLTSRARMMGKDNEDHLTITELVPNSKITFSVDGTTGKFTHTFEIVDHGNGECQLSKSMNVIQAHFPISLLKPLLPLIAGKGLNTDLQKIKAILEQN